MSVTCDVIRERAIKSGICRKCGNRRTRTKTFEQPFSSFNKNEYGRPKTRDEIRAELHSSALTWLGADFICARCEK